MKENAIIVDIDGTLANVDHRISYLEKDPKDWGGFHSNMGDDLLNRWCFNIISNFSKQDFCIILLTGRSDEYLALTKAWLLRHKVTYHKIFMRKESDFREDAIIKKEFYENIIKEKYDVNFVLEDRLSVVKMWRGIGLTCLQCDWGNF